MSNIMTLLNQKMMLAVCVSAIALLSACSDSKKSTSSTTEPPPRTDERAACIEPNDQARDKVLTQLSQATPGTVVSFCEGTFNMPTGLLINSKKGVTLKGAGMDKTILNFANSDSAEGINASNADGIVLEGFTIEDTPGNGVRIFRSSQVHVKDVRVRWHDAEGRNEKDAGYTPREDVGAYGLYPVETRQVLMENCESHGASDAGIYVGQSSDILVRNCLATYNVAGFEFENTYRAVFEDNIATKNTGGFLVFDLPDLRQYGQKNILRRNKSYENNTPNFAPAGNIVGLVPRGTGMLVLASDQLEVYDNDIYNNESLGIAIVNFGLVDRNYPDKRYDFFPEGVEIHNNRFSGNGGNPQIPSADRGVASALPLLLRVKNMGRGADIVWDGGEDTPNDCTDYPKDFEGVPLNQPNSNEKGRYESRVDERGRPNFDRADQEPKCKYNAWKFDAEKNLKKPENGLCIHSNTHSLSARSPLVTPFLNAKFDRSDLGQETVQQLLTPGSSDASPHNCDLPSRPEPVLNLPYEIVAEDVAPTAAEVAAACNAVQPGQVNWAALANYDCPELSQYGLFKEPNNPLSEGNGTAIPYELNSTLFSDYASKYRVIFLPPNGSSGVKPAVYQDYKSTRNANETLDFPVGTVISKTFTFRDEDADGQLKREHIVETRLLIKRKTSVGETWVGLPYAWEQGADGRPTKAVLKLAGQTVPVVWDYLDPNPNVKKNGVRARYTGTAKDYSVPAALNCIGCHGGDDRVGAAPIGPKARNMDRGMNKDLTGENQLAYMARKGWLTGYNADESKRDKPMAIMDIPSTGPTKPTAGSARDLHERVRAYLEVNCAYCHNGSGNASNSGLFLDSFRPVNVRYGICKKPVAAGRGSGGHKYDIVLGSPGTSILAHRLGSAEAGVRMPPIARTVVHGEAVALINEWISTGLAGIDAEDENEISNENNCTDSELPYLFTEVLPPELTSGLAELQAATGGLVTLKNLTDLLGMITGGTTEGLSSATQLLERSLKGVPSPTD
jgi:parallel beta-helix repeat protein